MSVLPASTSPWGQPSACASAFPAVVPVLLDLSLKHSMRPGLAPLTPGLVLGHHLTSAEPHTPQCSYDVISSAPGVFSSKSLPFERNELTPSEPQNLSFGQKLGLTPSPVDLSSTWAALSGDQQPREMNT